MRLALTLSLLTLLGCGDAEDANVPIEPESSPPRFVLIDDFAGGHKLFSRAEVSGLPYREAQSPGGFLARLWTRFGAPTGGGDAMFEYAIEDRQRGVRFSAYSAQSGPSYGGRGDPEESRPSVEAFELMLAATEPSDCELVVGSEVEYGGGQLRVGWRDGRAFEEEVDPLDPRDASTYEDCLRIATERGARMHEDAGAGWLFSLERVLPGGFRAGGRRFENIITLGSDERGLILTCDEGDGLEDVPVSSGVFVPPPDPVAALWLRSYERWDRETSDTRP